MVQTYSASLPSDWLGMIRFAILALVIGLIADYYLFDQDTRIIEKDQLCRRPLASLCHFR